MEQKISKKGLLVKRAAPKNGVVNAKMLKSCRYILFDLDGTIIDSEPGIFNSIKYALNSMGTDVDQESSLRAFIGPPIKESFVNVLGFTEEKAEEAIAKYREYYSKKGIFECSLYDGMAELIKKLQNKDYKIILATSKPEVFAKQILEHFDLVQHFSLVSGCGLDGTRSSKSEVIESALISMKVNNLSEAVIIGDRKYDIIGAKETGIKSIGVLYGYGNLQELREAGADYIAENVKDLEEFFL